MEWAVALQVEKADRETLEQMYGALTRLLVRASPPPAPERTWPGAARDRLAALAQLAETARNQCQFNVSVGHSASWFAVRSRQIALGQVCS